MSITDPQEHDEQSQFNRPLAIVVAGTFFLENLDGTIIQTALPAIGRSFGLRAVDAGIAISVYLLVLAICVPLGGWLADRIGVRQVFLAAILMFTATSVACGFATGIVSFCLSRAAQGFAGALMVPVGRLAILNVSRGRDLMAAIAYLNWPGLAAPLIAPALGGLLTDTIGWPWEFFINGPIGVALFIAGVRLVPAGTNNNPRGFDLIGFTLLSIALVASYMTLDGFDSTDLDGTVIAALTCAAITLPAAIVWMSRARHPLISFRPLLIPTFRASNLGGSIYRLLVISFPFLYSLLFQVGFGWSALKSGLLVAAVFAGNIGIKPFTSFIIRRFGFKVTIIVCAVANGVMASFFVFVSPTTPAVLVAFVLIVAGMFRSLGFTAYTTMQFGDVPPYLTSTANTFAATAQQIAIAFGIAVATLAVHTMISVASAVAPDTVALGYHLSFAVFAALLLLPVIETALLPRDAGASVSGR